MNNDLMALNNILFEQIERINDDSLTQEDRDSAIKRAQTINSLATTIVNNSKVQLNALDRFGNSKGAVAITGIEE